MRIDRLLNAVLMRKSKAVDATAPGGSPDARAVSGEADRPWSETFGEAERSAFRLQLRVRALVLLLIAASFFATVPPERALTYAAFCGGLVLVGIVVDRIVARLSTSRWRPLAALLILLDVTLLCVVIAVPSLAMEHPWPPQMALRFYTFLYLPLYVMGSALTTSPAIVLWTGASAAAVWSACVWWVLRQPGTISVGSLRLVDADIGTAEQLHVFLDPRFVSIVAYQAQLLVLLVGSAVLAFGVWRSRAFLLERTRIAAERRSLARFVPTELADDLAAGPRPGAVQRRTVAVLFVDIVGYTAMAERLKPEAALRILGEFRERVAAAVLAHGGTVDKFIGDAVMATFGTSAKAPELDAVAALGCALAMHDDLDAWTRERVGGGDERLRIGIGLHCGEALVGTIGSPDRLEHTVIGDVVNVASRLEQLTRETDASVLVSEAVFAKAKRAGSDMSASARFGPAIDLAIRGRRKTVTVRPLVPSLNTGGAMKGAVVVPDLEVEVAARTMKRRQLSAFAFPNADRQPSGPRSGTGASNGKRPSGRETAANAYGIGRHLGDPRCRDIGGPTALATRLIKHHPFTKRIERGPKIASREVVATSAVEVARAGARIERCLQQVILVAPSMRAFLSSLRRPS